MTGLDDLALFIAVEGAYAITWMCLKYRSTQRNADRNALNKVSKENPK